MNLCASCIRDVKVATESKSPTGLALRLLLKAQELEITKVRKRSCVMHAAPPQESEPSGDTSSED